MRGTIVRAVVVVVIVVCLVVTAVQQTRRAQTLRVGAATRARVAIVAVIIIVIVIIRSVLENRAVHLVLVCGHSVAQRILLLLLLLLQQGVRVVRRQRNSNALGCKHTHETHKHVASEACECGGCVERNR